LLDGALGVDCHRRTLKIRPIEDQDPDIEILTLGTAQRGGENWIEFDPVGSGFRSAFRIETTTGSRLRAEPSARIGLSDNDCAVSSPGFLAAISSSNQNHPARSVHPRFGFENPADRVSSSR
jgi:hypothetical protein